MSRSVETLYRQWLLLSKVPRSPRRITVSKLESILSAEGYDVNTRTIQRDLINLSVTFPLNNETEGRTNFWFWIEGAAIQDLPGMDPVTALAFQMAESFLLPIVPSETLTVLQPYFVRAKEVLNTSSTQLKEWPKKVAIIERGPTLLKPSINPQIQQLIYQGLLEEKQLSVTYNVRHTRVKSDFIVNPLGIVNKQNSLYLVCTLWTYTDIKQFALHRFESVEILEEKAHIPDAFNLSTYLKQSHSFSYPIGESPIELKVLFEEPTAAHLYETPLSENQILQKQEDGRILLEATVMDTQELRWWLSGFSSKVTVLEPIELRQYFIDELRQLTQYYELDDDLLRPQLSY